MSFPLFLERVAPTVARIIGLLSLSVALAGCSAVRLGYSSLPEVGYWWLDGYLDFEDGQSQRVREDIARLHAWHRATELPQVTALLRRMEQLVPADTSAEQVCALVPDVLKRLDALRDRAEPSIVTTAISLSGGQLQHLERKYEQNNREYRRDWLRLSPAEQLDKRQKMVLERIEMVYGNLADAQRTVLRQQLERSAFDPNLGLAERRRRQQDTLGVLRKLTTQPVPLQEARDGIRALLDRMITSPDPAYRAYQDTLRTDSCRMVAAVHNATTPAQREHATRRLQGWQRDLTELSTGR